MRTNNFNYKIEGKIYYITECDNTGEDVDILYIGSTEKTISARFLYHQIDALDPTGKKYNWKMYTYMRSKGVMNFKINLLEDYPCKTREDLKRREYYYINQNPTVFNVIKSYEDELRIFGNNTNNYKNTSGDKKMFERFEKVFSLKNEKSIEKYL